MIGPNPKLPAQTAQRLTKTYQNPASAMISPQPNKPAIQQNPYQQALVQGGGAMGGYAKRGHAILRGAQNARRPQNNGQPGSIDNNSYSGLQKHTQSLAQQAGQQAAGSRNAFEQAAYGFNAQDYMKTAGQQFMKDTLNQFQTSEAARAGSLNQRGLFNSDLGGHEATTALNQEISQGANRLAMEAGKMQQDNTRMIQNQSQYDQTNQNQWNDATIGLGASHLQQKYADEKAKREGRAAILQGALGVAGTVAAGPIGAAVGNWIGGKLGF